jgi:predicted nucleic acid-binding protein
MFTIDSNILIYYLEGDPAVREKLASWLLRGERLFISAITRIELFAAPALDVEEESKINKLLGSFVMLPVDAQIADVAARIKRTYRLPLGDSIIGATSFLTRAPLVTRNIRDFKKIKEITLYPL